MSGGYDGVSPWRCTECGHDHTGRAFAYICIGCSCEFVPDHPEVDATVPRWPGHEPKATPAAVKDGE